MNKTLIIILSLVSTILIGTSVYLGYRLITDEKKSDTVAENVEKDSTPDTDTETDTTTPEVEEDLPCEAGDFAQAYVVAHEVGHHVQTLLGISEQVQKARAQSSEVQGNQLSVRQELQADCFAGIWAHHNQQRTQFLEQGDIEEAMDAFVAFNSSTVSDNFWFNSICSRFRSATIPSK